MSCLHSLKHARIRKLVGQTVRGAVESNYSWHIWKVGEESVFLAKCNDCLMIVWRNWWKQELQWELTWFTRDKSLSTGPKRRDMTSTCHVPSYKERILCESAAIEKSITTLGRRGSGSICRIGRTNVWPGRRRSAAYTKSSSSEKTSGDRNSLSLTGTNGFQRSTISLDFHQRKPREMQF